MGWERGRRGESVERVCKLWTLLKWLWLWGLFFCNCDWREGFGVGGLVWWMLFFDDEVGFERGFGIMFYLLELLLFLDKKDPKCFFECSLGDFDLECLFCWLQRWVLLHWTKSCLNEGLSSFLRSSSGLVSRLWTFFIISIYNQLKIAETLKRCQFFII